MPAPIRYIDRNRPSNDPTMFADNFQLYTSLMRPTRYRYAREFQTDIQAAETRELTIDNINFTTITIVGVPDGIDVRANEAIIKKNTVKRLYILSDIELSENYLSTVDSFYGKMKFPIIECATLVPLVSYPPINNFYVASDVRPNTLSTFVEYRYLQQRHMTANICVNATGDFLCRIVLPKRPLLVIIMPQNFVRTSQKSGYFLFEHNIVIRVYSKYLLACAQNDDAPDLPVITQMNINDRKFMDTINEFFGRLGFHKIASHTPNHVYAFDKYMTVIVGSIANVLLPT